MIISNKKKKKKRKKTYGHPVLYLIGGVLLNINIMHPLTLKLHFKQLFYKKKDFFLSKFDIFFLILGPET